MQTSAAYQEKHAVLKREGTSVYIKEEATGMKVINMKERTKTYNDCNRNLVHLVVKDTLSQEKQQPYNEDGLRTSCC